jgi:hypothetical protein
VDNPLFGRARTDSCRKACAGQFLEPLLGLCDLRTILLVERVAGVTGMIHHDLACHFTHSDWLPEAGLADPESIDCRPHLESIPLLNGMTAVGSFACDHKYPAHKRAALPVSGVRTFSLSRSTSSASLSESRRVTGSTMPGSTASRRSRSASFSPAVAILLAREAKDLLIGESADPDLINTIWNILTSRRGIDAINHVRTIHSVPDSIFVAISAEFEPGMMMGDGEANRGDRNRSEAGFAPDQLHLY